MVCLCVCISYSLRIFFLTIEQFTMSIAYLHVGIVRGGDLAKRVVHHEKIFRSSGVVRFFFLSQKPKEHKEGEQERERARETKEVKGKSETKNKKESWRGTNSRRGEVGRMRVERQWRGGARKERGVSRNFHVLAWLFGLFFCIEWTQTIFFCFCCLYPFPHRTLFFKKEKRD